MEGEWSDDPGSPWPEGGAGDDLMFGGAFPDQYSPAHPAYYELNTSSGDDDAPPGEPGQEGEEEEWQDAGEGWQEEWRDDDEEGEGGEAGGHSRDNTPLPESHEPPSSPSSGSYGGSDPEGSQQPGPAAGGGGAAASSRRGSGRGKGRGKGGGGGGGQA